MNISIDIDGVLTNGFVDAFAAAVRKTGVEVPNGYSPTDYAFSDIVPTYKTQEMLAATYATPDLWESMSELPGAVELANSLFDLQKDRIDVYLLTHRPKAPGKTSQVQTWNWMRQRGLVHPNTSLIVVGSSAVKSRIIESLDIKFSLDDLPKTVFACNEIPGHQAYLMDATWNQNVPSYFENWRVRSVAEFLKIVIDNF